MKALRQPQMVQRIAPVRAAHRRETGRGQTAAQNLCRGLSNPLQAGLPGAVVKGQHQQNAAARGGAALLGRLSANGNRRGKGHSKPQPRCGSHLPNLAETRWEKGMHDGVIIGVVAKGVLSLRVIRFF